MVQIFSQRFQNIGFALGQQGQTPLLPYESNEWGVIDQTAKIRRLAQKKGG
jgi:hypothetical protein